MDAILEVARDLGREIQNDGRFVRTQLAQAAADEDAALQDMIGEFNLKRMAINAEMAKEEKDGDKMKALDAELREVYGRLMANEHMQAYQQAKAELDKLLTGISTIVALSAQGQDPDSIPDEGAGCGGDCSSCSGCH